MTNRRKVIRQIGAGMAVCSVMGGTMWSCNNSAKTAAKVAETVDKAKNLFFKISLAQWSLHRGFFGEETLKKGWSFMREAFATDPSSALQGEFDVMDFPKIARENFDINAIELVNTFYFDKSENQDFLNEFKQRCDDHGVKTQLIMCDAEGDLGDKDAAVRQQTVENHYKWVNMAKFLGAESIRVNAAGAGTAEEVQKNAADGLAALGEYAAKENINVIVENHGGHSSNGAWLAGLMQQVNMTNVGTLPDFGNFCIERDYQNNTCRNSYDMYQGTKELMPFAKGVSAKSHSFDENGNETEKDFSRLLQIVKDAGFGGYIGIEYEGNGPITESEGIRLTKVLLEKVGATLS